MGPMGGSGDTSVAADEAALIAACQRGDKEMFRPLVEKYRQRSFLLALQIVGNREDALDISQESFIRAYENIRRFDLGKPFGAWLFRIVRNLCIDHLRRLGVRRSVSLDATGRGGRTGDEEGRPLHETLGDPRAEAADVLVERNELRERIWHALGRLEPHHREILILRDYQDLTYEEIAGVLGIPKGTVMSRLHHARRKLAVILEGVV